MRTTHEGTFEELGEYFTAEAKQLRDLAKSAKPGPAAKLIGQAEGLELAVQIRDRWRLAEKPSDDGDHSVPSSQYGQPMRATTPALT